MGTAVTRNARLEFRAAAAQKELIERAAFLTGQTVSAYAVSTLVENATQVVEYANRIKLGERDRELFLALLDADAEPNEALRKAAADYRNQQAR